MKPETLPRPPGRPRAPPDKALTARAELRLTPAQKEKLELLGGPDWIRDRIDKAKIPARPPG
jgi:hypothetical protein